MTTPLMEQTETQLLPCPMCGGASGYSLGEGSTYRWWSCRCADCGREIDEARATYPAETTPRTRPADTVWNEAAQHAQSLRDEIAKLRQQAADPAETFTADEVHAYCARARNETREEIIALLIEEHRIARGSHNYAHFYASKVAAMGWEKPDNP